MLALVGERGREEGEEVEKGRRRCFDQEGLKEEDEEEEEGRRALGVRMEMRFRIESQSYAQVQHTTSQYKNTMPPPTMRDMGTCPVPSHKELPPGPATPEITHTRALSRTCNAQTCCCCTAQHLPPHALHLNKRLHQHHIHTQGTDSTYAHSPSDRRRHHTRRQGSLSGTAITHYDKDLYW